MSATLESITDIDSLARLVLEIDENIKDYLDVTAILEALGVSDATAQRYGFPDKFQLSKKVLEIIQYYRQRGETVGAYRVPEQRRLLEAVKLVLVGSLLASPWLLFTLSYLFIGITLLPIGGPGLATMISLASILSLLVTSGIQTLFTRRITFYYYQQNYGAARGVLTLYYALSICIVFATGLLTLAVNNIFHIYPRGWIELSVIYFIPLSFLWISTAPLYALNAYTPLVFTFLASLLSINLALRMSMRSIYMQAHLYGIAVGAIIATIYFSVYLYVKERLLKAASPYQRELEARLPRLTYIIYSGFPYLVSSTLYFLFITADRLIAWFTAGNQPPLMDTTYEFSVNLALLLLVPVFGILNYCMARIYGAVSEGGRGVEAKRIEEYRNRIKSAYWRALLAVSLTGLISHAVICLLTLKFNVLQLSVYPKVLIYAGIADTLLSLFLVNSLICFYFYLPRPIITSLTLGLAVDVLVGLPLAKTMGIQYASIGYLAGAAVLAVVSIVNTYRYVREADYSYYSAF